MIRWNIMDIIFSRRWQLSRTREETLPYRVGTFYYGEGCGLYIIAAYQSENEKCLMEKLLTALSYTGIGGKKSGGLGKYRYNEGQIPEQLLECLQKNRTDICYCQLHFL